MKKMFLLLSVGMLCFSVAWAQDSTPAGQSAASSSNTSAGMNTVQGCLSGTDGNYLLTEDGTGATYKLMGSDNMLKKHLGHEVAVTGQAANDSGSQASASDQGQAQPAAGGTTIQVSNVKMVAKQCRGSAGGSQSPQ